MSDDHPDALRKGTRVKEYKILRVLGQGGFGITYLAFDLNLNGPVALKEYFPTGYARRLADASVGPASADTRDVFDWGLKRFLDEARAIHRLRHPNVVRAHRYFEARGGAYIVMEYVEGDSLAKILKDRPRLTFDEWRPLFDKLLDGLEHVHDHDYLHRDLKPGNIVVRDADGAPVLIDFGSARIAAGERTNTQMVTDGYAPIEQYGRGKQGPPADLYALAAVSYRVLLGERPPIAPDRVTNDTVSLLAERVNVGTENRAFEKMGEFGQRAARRRKRAERDWLAALDRCLALQPKDRPRSVVALREEFWKRSRSAENHAVQEYRRRFELPKSGRGMTLVEPLAPPYGAWNVRRWVGRRSSGALQAAVFAPTHGGRRPREGETLFVRVKDKKSVRLVRWDPSAVDDTPLWERGFDSEFEAFSGLLRQERSGAIERAARERLEREFVAQGQLPKDPSSTARVRENPQTAAPNPPAPAKSSSTQERSRSSESRDWSDWAGGIGCVVVFLIVGLLLAMPDAC